MLRFCAKIWIACNFRVRLVQVSESLERQYRVLFRGPVFIPHHSTQHHFILYPDHDYYYYYFIVHGESINGVEVKEGSPLVHHAKVMC